MSEIQGNSSEHVTVMVSRRVKPGREQEFEGLLSGMAQTAQGFPGYLGANIIRPSSKTQPEYVVIFRFNSYPELARWEESPVRQEWLKQADRLADSALQIQRIPGLEFWFTPPDRSTPAAPPRYKLAIILTLVIFSLSLLVTPMLTGLLGILPALLRQLVVVAIQVTLITYLILPFLTRLLSRWLFASR